MFAVHSAFRSRASGAGVANCAGSARSGAKRTRAICYTAAIIASACRRNADCAGSARPGAKRARAFYYTAAIVASACNKRMKLFAEEEYFADGVRVVSESLMAPHFFSESCSYLYTHIVCAGE